MIKTHLGKPDLTQAGPRGRLRKRIEYYDRDRVFHAESTSAKADLVKLTDARELARRALARKHSRD